MANASVLLQITNYPTAIPDQVNIKMNSLKTINVLVNGVN